MSKDNYQEKKKRSINDPQGRSYSNVGLIDKKNLETMKKLVFGLSILFLVSLIHYLIFKPGPFFPIIIGIFLSFLGFPLAGHYITQYNIREEAKKKSIREANHCKHCWTKLTVDMQNCPLCGKINPLIKTTFGSIPVEMDQHCKKCYVVLNWKGKCDQCD